MVLKSVHTIPMLNSTSLSKSSWPWFLSTYFCFCIWSIHRSPYKSVLCFPKQMVEKLGVCQTYKVHVLQKCKSTPSATRFANHLLGERPSVRYTEGKILLHEPVHFEMLTQFQNVFFAAFGSGPVPEYLVSYRTTKDHVTFHSIMYPRKGNLCSYLVQFCAHGRKCYGRVFCYFLV